MKVHPLLTAELETQTSIRGAFTFVWPYLAMLGAWFALSVIAVVLHFDSALLRMGIVLAPLGALLFVGSSLLQWSGDASRTRELQKLLESPERIQKLELTTSRRRNLTRHWLVVSAAGSPSLELVLRSDARALWEELVRVFPEATRAASVPAASTYRHPRELVLVNAAAKTIEASVVVVGPSSKRFVRELLQATGGAAPGPEQAGGLEQVVMTLGAIRGWTPRFFVYALDGSYEGVAPELLAAADAVVLVQPGAEGAPPDPALRSLAMLPRARQGALAFVGPKSALAELPARPDVVGHDGQAMPVFKELAKHIFARLPAG